MQSSFKKIIVVAVTGLMIQACGKSTPDQSAVKFDSAHSVALDATIPDGVLISTSNDAAVNKAEIQSQLFYTMGQLNGENGVADLARLEISVNAAQAAAGAQGLFEIHYAAKVLVSWDKLKAVPATYDFYMPSRGDFQGLSAFYNAFKDKCTDPEAHDLELGIYWYYYRPQNCQDVKAAVGGLAQKLTANLVVSGENTEGKSPEYAKVWEDGKLVVTAIFAKYEAGATDNFDAGISGYNTMYNNLRQTYGAPTTQNVELGTSTQPGVANSDVHLTWTLPAGTLDVEIFLVDDIKMVDQAFKDKYNQRTEISDFVSYSGHAGLGANIRQLAKLGHFLPGQYQVFLINGCDTFSYVDNALRDAHAAANPGSEGSKYFDMITNAMPSFFQYMPMSNMIVIDAMVGKTETYRDLLKKFDTSQKAAVTGEQDNT